MTTMMTTWLVSSDEPPVCPDAPASPRGPTAPLGCVVHDGRPHIVGHAAAVFAARTTSAPVQSDEEWVVPHPAASTQPSVASSRATRIVVTRSVAVSLTGYAFSTPACRQTRGGTRHVAVLCVQAMRAVPFLVACPSRARGDSGHG